MATLLDTRYTYYQVSGTNTPEENYTDRRFIFYMYLDYQDTANNRSRIYITKKVQVVQGHYWDIEIGGGYIAGSTVNGSSYASDTISKDNDDYGTFTIASDYYWVDHNADGTGSFYYRARGAALQDYDYNYVAQRTLTLPTIPRYANITSFTATVKNPEQIDVAWATDATCDDVDYSIDGGSSYVDPGGSGTSGSFSITGLTAGTEYDVKIRVRRTDSQLYTYSSILTRTTHSLSTISSGASFNIGDAINLTINRYDSNYTHQIVLKARASSSDAWTTIHTTASGIGTSHTINLSTSEKENLYDLIPDQQTAQVQFVTGTFRDGTDYGDTTLEGIATVTNSAPVFTTFTHEDRDAVTYALTNDRSKYISGYSNIRATVSEANKATPQNGASIESYKLVVGSKQVTEGTGSTLSSITVGDDLSNKKLYFDFSEPLGSTQEVVKPVTCGSNYIEQQYFSSTGNTYVYVYDASVGTTTVFKYESGVHEINLSELQLGSSFGVVTAIDATADIYSDITIDSSDILLEIDDVLDDTASVYAIDSRGIETQIDQTLNMTEYSGPLISAASIARTNNVDEETTLTFNGTYENWTGLSTNNSIQTAQYRYKEVGGSYGSYIALTLDTNTGGNYTFSDTINGDEGTSGFDTTKSYMIEISITDQLETITTEVTLNSAQPILWKWKNTLKSLIGIGKKPDTTMDHGSIDAAGDINADGGFKIDGSDIFEKIYPVGAIYMSVSSTNPATLFGGTWVAWGAGRVPVGIDTSDSAFDSVEETGGAKTHTLTEDEMPSHEHRVDDRRTDIGDVHVYSRWNGSNPAGSGSLRTQWDDVGGPYSVYNGLYAVSTGSDDPHNNLQPYIVCYMWKRTAL